MNLHSGRTLTDAIVFALTSAGLAAGDGEAPEDAGWQGAPANSDFVGYVVVYELSGGTADGPIGTPDADAETLYQLTSVGRDRRQCKLVADQARNVLMSAQMSITDRTVMRVSIDMLGGTIRDDDVQPSVMYSPDRYRILTTPT